MAVRHTVYLKQSAAKVTPKQILESIRAVEWGFVAESCGVPMSKITEADENLSIANVGKRGFVRYELTYRPGKVRQVSLERWKTQAEVQGVLAEVLDNLKPRAKSTPKVRKFLAECVDIVDASYGSEPGEAMAPILGSQVCLWLALNFDGIICDPSDKWYEPEDEYNLKPL